MTIGERIKEIRKELGITQSELGAKMGLSYQTVAQWETGKRNPKYETLQKIANALSIDVLTLLPAESQEDIESFAEEVIQRHPDRDKNETIRKLIEQELQDLAFERLSDAQDMSDEFTVTCYENFSDSSLKQQLLESFRYLSRRGKIEAVIRIDELSENPRFKRRF